MNDDIDMDVRLTNLRNLIHNEETKLKLHYQEIVNSVKGVDFEKLSTLDTPFNNFIQNSSLQASLSALITNLQGVDYSKISNFDETVYNLLTDSLIRDKVALVIDTENIIEKIIKGLKSVKHFESWFTTNVKEVLNEASFKNEIKNIVKKILHSH